jgi:hypothetical protein
MWIISLAAAADTEVCARFGSPEGPSEVIVDDLVGEIQSSGLAASQVDEGVYYTHDDQGGDARLYLFRDDGDYIGAQTISGATNTDWEDVASGPCPNTVDAETCLWIGDIGEAEGDRATLTLWVVPASTDANEEAVACHLTWPEGKSHDAEALLLWPDGTVRIVTKEDDGAKVYRAPNLRCDGGAAQEMIKEAELDLSEPVTGGAVSVDGSQVVLRGLTEAWLWTGCSVSWSDTPVSVDLGEQPQGEAITFALDGALITTSEVSAEGEPLRWWRTPCEEVEVLACPTCGCGDAAGALVLLPLLGLTRRRAGAGRGTGA